MEERRHGRRHDGLESGFDPFTVVGSTMFFRAREGDGGFGLWKTDGIAAGTRHVRDLTPGGGTALPFNLTRAGDKLYFLLIGAQADTELWSSDGSEQGTERVFTFRGWQLGFSNMLEVDGALFFSAVDPVYGAELWRSNGTAAGTYRVTDLHTGLLNAWPHQLTNINESLIFLAVDDDHGVEPWFVPASPPVGSGDYDQDDDVDGADLLEWQRRLGSIGVANDANFDGAIGGDDLPTWETSFGLYGATKSDFDGDGDSDGTDFLQWQRGVGGGPSPVDGSRNGAIDQADLPVWQAAFGRFYGSVVDALAVGATASDSQLSSQAQGSRSVPFHAKGSSFLATVVSFTRGVEPSLRAFATEGGESGAAYAKDVEFEDYPASPNRVDANLLIADDEIKREVGAWDAGLQRALSSPDEFVLTGVWDS